MVIDVRFRVHHPCPYCDLSVRFPESLLLLWCDNRRDVFLVSSPTPDQTASVLATLRRQFHGRVIVRQGRDALVELPEFEWKYPPSVTGMARRTGVFVLPPVVYSDGRETYRILAPDARVMRAFLLRLRRLGDVELLSVHPRTDLGPIRELPLGRHHFLEGLTDRQARSLVRGFDDGLLEVPARGRWGTAAQREGLSRSTFGEHLRKGQWRLLANAYPALRARVEVPATPVVLKKLNPRRSGTAPRRRRRRAS